MATVTASTTLRHHVRARHTRVPCLPFSLPCSRNTGAPLPLAALAMVTIVGRPYCGWSHVGWADATAAAIRATWRFSHRTTTYPKVATTLCCLIELLPLSWCQCSSRTLAVPLPPPALGQGQAVPSWHLMARSLEVSPCGCFCSFNATLVVVVRAMSPLPRPPTERTVA